MVLFEDVFFALADHALLLLAVLEHLDVPLQRTFQLLRVPLEQDCFLVRISELLFELSTLQVHAASDLLGVGNFHADLLPVRLELLLPCELLLDLQLKVFVFFLDLPALK